MLRGLRQGSRWSCDLVGVGVKGRGVNDSASATVCTASRGQRNCDATHRGDLPDCRINDRLGLSLGSGGGCQGGKFPAASRIALTRTQQDLRGCRVGPAVTELPHLTHAVTDEGRLHARATQYLAEAVTNRFGEHRAEGLVVVGQLVDGDRQFANARISRAVDRRQTQLCRQVHQQLVATCGNTRGQSVGRVAGIDLLGTQLVGVGHEDLDGVRGRKRDVRNVGARRTTCGSHRSGRRGHRGGRNVVGFGGCGC